MSRKSSVRRRRAWDVLQLALLWARRGGVFKNRLVINRSLLQKGIRKLRHSHHHAPPLVYGERELSFDDTPVIHVKMHRPSSLRFKMPHIPCINPHVDFDYDFEFDDVDDHDEIYGCGGAASAEEEVSIGDEEVDLKAEEFIANFYKQMKLQRQISYLQYSEKGSRD